MSTPTGLWLSHVHFSAFVLALSHQKCLSPNTFLLSGSVFGHVYFILRLLQQHQRYSRFFPWQHVPDDNMWWATTLRLSMASYGFSLKAGPKCTKVFVSNEKALVWTSSQCGIVEKAAWKRSSFDAFVNTKRRFFKVHSFAWKQPEIQIKQRELNLLLYSHYTTCLTLFKSSKSDQRQFSPNDIHTLSRG